MDHRKRFIGKVVLFWNGAQLPTDFFSDYYKSRLIFIAETEVPHDQGRKIISTAPQLVDLLRAHRRNVESFYHGGEV